MYDNLRCGEDEHCKHCEFNNVILREQEKEIKELKKELKLCKEENAIFKKSRNELANKLAQVSDGNFSIKQMLLKNIKSSLEVITEMELLY